MKLPDRRRGALRCSAVLLGIAALLGVTGAQAAICYVDASAAGGMNNGGSWADAYTDLQSALGDAGCTENWVAAGVYRPTATTDQSISFEIPPGVALYGGFAGTETARSQRNPFVNVTVLSADIDHNDLDSDGNQIDEVSSDIQGNNAWHVVKMDGVSGDPVSGSTVLDGFVITAGDAGGVDFPDFTGGGLYCAGNGAGHECSPVLANVIFTGNNAEYGGAIYNYGYQGESSPALTDVVFRGNSAGNSGGAIYNNGRNYGDSHPVLTNVTFTDNRAVYGGGVVNSGENGGSSSPTLDKVTFSGNQAVYGGAMYNDGQQGASSPRLSNVTFSNNSATYGGAMVDNGRNGGLCTAELVNVTFGDNGADYGGAIYIYGVAGTSAASLTNVILWNDTATSSGAEIYNGGGTPTIGYSVVQGGVNGSAIDNQDGGSVTDGGGNLDTDPVLGPLQYNGGFTQTMLLRPGSSAIDTGDDSHCPAEDQRGVPRPQGAHCDIGAIEARPDLIFADGFDSAP